MNVSPTWKASVRKEGIFIALKHLKHPWAKVALLENVKGFRRVIDQVLEIMDKNLPGHLGETLNYDSAQDEVLLVPPHLQP